MITGLSHLTIIVSNLERTAKLLSEGLGALEVYDSQGKNFSISDEKFFLLGNIWLVAMRGEITQRSYRHIAFQVASVDMPKIEKKLRKLGAEIAFSRPRAREEGKSLYFYDYDNNLFELHSGTLEQRLPYYQQHNSA